MCLVAGPKVDRVLVAFARGRNDLYTVAMLVDHGRGGVDNRAVSEVEEGGFLQMNGQKI